MDIGSMKVGIEMESWTDMTEYSFGIGDYHHNNTISVHWNTQRDSSINGAGSSFHNGRPVEFVSNCFEYTDFDKVIKNIKRKLLKTGKELNETIHFNKSAGVHIHFSPPSGAKIKEFGKRARINFYKSIRDSFIKRIKDSSIGSKQEIVDNYFRGFAKKTTNITKENTKERQREFNFRSEESGKGMEWRSPNMCGIKTWNEFDTFWNIIKESLLEIAKYDWNYTVVHRTKEIKVEVQSIKHSRCTMDFSKKKIRIKENLKFNKKDKLKLRVGGDV